MLETPALITILQRGSFKYTKMGKMLHAGIC